jgi:hypothetical protein
MCRSPARNVGVAAEMITSPTVVTEVTAMAPEQTVFELWCRLTGSDLVTFDEAEREAFLARPQVPALAATPYDVLLDAGITAARRGSLPLERWLAAARLARAAPARR